MGKAVVIPLDVGFSTWLFHRRALFSTECTRVVDGVRFIDAEAWWGSIDELPRPVPSSPVSSRTQGSASGRMTMPRQRKMRQKMDQGRLFVRDPVLAVSAIGGIPIRLGTSVPRDCVELGIGPVGKGPVVHVKDLADAFRRQMGLAGFPSYLNPKGISADQMWDVVAKHRHFSVAHAASVSFVMAGHSCAVENEFNCQRDIIHIARLTVARTAAQANPPLVVPHRELLPAYRRVRESTAGLIEEMKQRKRPEEMNVGDWQEARFAMFPAAKAHVAVVTGSLRNLQKLSGEMSSGGKEIEYVRLLSKMNDSLHAMLPDMFAPSPDCISP
eukprot:jgi/Bigna1/71256/fgenesh1_pg.15_\